MKVHDHVYVYMCIRVYVYMCIRVYVYMCICVLGYQFLPLFPRYLYWILKCSDSVLVFVFYFIIHTGGWLRHSSIKVCIRSVNPSSNCLGSIAIKHWPWNKRKSQLLEYFYILIIQFIFVKCTYSETCLNQTTLGPTIVVGIDRCLAYTG